MISKGERERRLAALEANRLREEETGEEAAMPLIWGVLEQYPRVKAEVERIKGIRAMGDNEAVSSLLDVLDNHPEAKAACLARITYEMERAKQGGIKA